MRYRTDVPFTPHSFLSKATDIIFERYYKVLQLFSFQCKLFFPCSIWSGFEYAFPKMTQDVVTLTVLINENTVDFTGFPTGQSNLNPWSMKYQMKEGSIYVQPWVQLYGIYELSEVVLQKQENKAFTEVMTIDMKYNDDTLIMWNHKKEQLEEFKEKIINGLWIYNNYGGINLFFLVVFPTILGQCMYHRYTTVQTFVKFMEVFTTFECNERDRLFPFHMMIEFFPFHMILLWIPFHRQLLELLNWHWPHKLHEQKSRGQLSIFFGDRQN